MARERWLEFASWSTGQSFASDESDSVDSFSIRVIAACCQDAGMIWVCQTLGICKHVMKEVMHMVVTHYNTT